MPPPRPGTAFALPRPTGRALRPRRRSRAGWVLGGAAALAFAVIVAVLVVNTTAPTTAPVATAAPGETGAPVPTTTPVAEASASPSPATDPADPTAQAIGVLSTLAVVSGEAPVPYDRDLFGQRWADVDRNGCDTRNDILGRDLLDPVFKPGTGECKVLSGTLLDPYDGSAVEFVSGQSTSVLVQIDHVVALGWAWHHGAYAWTDEQRLAFANDPLNLLAASQATNQSKSAAGPADWLPPNAELSCRYVERWVSVLGDYGLGIDAADRTAARAVLDAC